MLAFVHEEEISCDEAVEFSRNAKEEEILEFVKKLGAWDAYKRAHNKLKDNINIFAELFLVKPRETPEEKEMHNLFFKYYQEALEKYKKVVDLLEENEQEKEETRALR